MSILDKIDPEVAQAIRQETERQAGNLEMIASENFVSEAVLEAQGSIMTNKYAEGYPGKRYYGGCEYVDVVETLAIERCKKLFGADHANVQPHSGTQAEYGGLFRGSPARRYDFRHEPLSRGPSVPWEPGQFLR